MAFKQIPISSLALGMHVTKLDISWLDSPFMYHNILIKSQSQIDKLIKADVKQVTIDTSKGKDFVSVVLGQESVGTKKITDAESLPSKNQSLPLERKKTSLESEMSVAKQLMTRMKSIISNMNESFKNGESINTEQVSTFIEETISSLQRNEQALTTLINMQRKDKSLSDHAFATFSLILSLSIKLNLSHGDKEMLGLSAFFHDVGWLKLPLNLLGKKSAYTVNEHKLIKQHVAIGQKTLLNQCNLPELALRIITEHHEFIDGSGYPMNLKSDAIHPLSKLFAVVVRYDELIHGLLDRSALTPNGALSTLFKEAKRGSLDPFSVSSLISLLSIYPVGSCVLLSNKEKARVIETCQDHPKQPKVKVFYDLSGVAHAQAKVLDLARQSTHKPLEIVSVLDLNDPKVDPARVLGEI